MNNVEIGRFVQKKTVQSWPRAVEATGGRVCPGLPPQGQAGEVAREKVLRTQTVAPPLGCVLKSDKESVIVDEYVSSPGLRAVEDAVDDLFVPFHASKSLAYICRNNEMDLLKRVLRETKATEQRVEVSDFFDGCRLLHNFVIDSMIEAGDELLIEERCPRELNHIGVR
jgi:hypothetical protein